MESHRKFWLAERSWRQRPSKCAVHLCDKTNITEQMTQNWHTESTGISEKIMCKTNSPPRKDRYHRSIVALLSISCKILPGSMRQLGTGTYRSVLFSPHLSAHQSEILPLTDALDTAADLYGPKLIVDDPSASRTYRSTFWYPKYFSCFSPVYDWVGGHIMLRYPKKLTIPMIICTSSLTQVQTSIETQPTGCYHSQSDFTPSFHNFLPI